MAALAAPAAFSKAARFGLRNVAAAILKGRRARDKLFPVNIFGEPAWDILLDLYIAEVDRSAISITSACLASGAPPTTGLRYIERLTQLGLLRRDPDPMDQRRYYARLTPMAMDAIEQWLCELVPNLATLLAPPPQ